MRQKKECHNFGGEEADLPLIIFSYYNLQLYPQEFRVKHRFTRNISGTFLSWREEVIQVLG